MYKKTLIVVAVAFLFGAPLISAAATSSTSVSATVTTPVSPCPIVNRSLSMGDRGSDVLSLQQFLSAQGDFTSTTTGYFGSLTKTAVTRWQTQNGITTSGTGVFGPLSRAFLSQQCGGGTPTGTQSFSATPTSGTAPLSVAFSTTVSGVSTSSYSVAFGDGQTGSMTKGNCIVIDPVLGGTSGGLQCSYNVSHTYTTGGTYSANLLKQASLVCPPNAMCASPSQVVATTTITVASATSTSPTFSVSPSSGTAPLSVQFRSSGAPGTDIGSTVNFGDGTSGKLLYAPTCANCNALGTVSHTYTSAGTYTATLTDNPCVCTSSNVCNCPNMSILGSATVTVASSTTTTGSNITQLNAPGSVSLQQGGIAEVINDSFYFTLQSLASTSATIQITPVGCWNSFPSSAPPTFRCMIAQVPIPPQTLSVGNSYASGNYRITLSAINNGVATFLVTMFVVDKLPSTS